MYTFNILSVSRLKISLKVLIIRKFKTHITFLFYMCCFSAVDYIQTCIEWTPSGNVLLFRILDFIETFVRKSSQCRLFLLSDVLTLASR
jgi:hypothetical protein